MHRPCLEIVIAAAVLASPMPNMYGQSWDQEEESRTQVLKLPPEPAAALTAESTRLVFGVATPRTRGLLSKQVRDTVKSLSRSLKHARIIRLRAFVASSGDARCVRQEVGEFYEKKKQPLPTLSVVQVGRLPVPGSQVVFEYVAEGREPRNPYGLVFVSGQTVTAPEPTLNVAPLARQSLDRIQRDLSGLGTTPPQVLLATCYCSSLMDGSQVHLAMTKAFPGAQVNLMQLRRSYTQGSVSCDAVARLMQPAVLPVQRAAGGDASTTASFSNLAVIGPGRVSFTSSQLAFRYQDSDIRLAFTRLGRVLQKNGTSFQRVVKSNIYPISLALAGKIRSLGFEFFDRTNPPANTTVELEGLASLDASFAMDVVAAVP